MIGHKLIAIVGPTASGKSALAVELAKKFHGEVISADSRQVYTGLDIGTGKVTKKEMSGVPHHMLDIASPKRVYSVAAYKKDAEKAFEKILKKNKLPIIAGGSGFYIDALLYNQQFPDVPPNKKLREKLSKFSAERLFALLKKKDPARAKHIDQHNKVRLIRALEIIEKNGKVSALKKENMHDAFIIGIKIDSKKLKEKINHRLLDRIQAGMVLEILRLHARGLSWKRMEALGLEYRYVSRYVRRLISKEEMVKKLNIEIWHYAKRQMTWWKRNKDIMWFQPSEKRKVFEKVENFLRK